MITDFAIPHDPGSWVPAFAGTTREWLDQVPLTWRSSTAAARLPERIAPSIVAGRPVAVQSPASARFLQRVAAGARAAFCAGVAANVARRSLMICPGGSGSWTYATPA